VARSAFELLVRVVADSHAIVWYDHDSPRQSDHARETLDEIELWYVTKTTARGVS